MVVLRSIVLTAALAAAGAAAAHVTVQPAAAAAGAYQALRFQLGHGCGDQATDTLRIELPPGVTVARPQPKPGWTLEMERRGPAVRAVTWRGRLPADQFDEFLLLVRVPAESQGRLLFPAIQGCGPETVRWDQPMSPAGARPKHPAPTLQVNPPAAPAAEAHHHH